MSAGQDVFVGPRAHVDRGAGLRGLLSGRRHGQDRRRRDRRSAGVCAGHGEKDRVVGPAIARLGGLHRIGVEPHRRDQITGQFRLAHAAVAVPVGLAFQGPGEAIAERAPRHAADRHLGDRLGILARAEKADMGRLFLPLADGVRRLGEVVQRDVELEPAPQRQARRVQRARHRAGMAGVDQHQRPGAAVGDLRVAQLQAAGGHVVMAGAGPLLMVVLADSDAQLGLVRVQAKRAAAEVTG